MPKLLNRWIALLLIPALVVDPAMAAVFNNPLSPHRLEVVGGYWGVFNEQALAVYPVWQRISRSPSIQAVKHGIVLMLEWIGAPRGEGLGVRGNRYQRTTGSLRFGRPSKKPQAADLEREWSNPFEWLSQAPWEEVMLYLSPSMLRLTQIIRKTGGVSSQIELVLKLLTIVPKGSMREEIINSFRNLLLRRLGIAPNAFIGDFLMPEILLEDLSRIRRLGLAAWNFPLSIKDPQSGYVPHTSGSTNAQASTRIREWLDSELVYRTHNHYVATVKALQLLNLFNLKQQSQDPGPWKLPQPPPAKSKPVIRRPAMSRDYQEEQTIHEGLLNLGEGQSWSLSGLARALKSILPDLSIPAKTLSGYLAGNKGAHLRPTDMPLLSEFLRRKNALESLKQEIQDGRSEAAQAYEKSWRQNAISRFRIPNNWVAALITASGAQATVQNLIASLPVNIKVEPMMWKSLSYLFKKDGLSDGYEAAILSASKDIEQVEGTNLLDASLHYVIVKEVFPTDAPLRTALENPKEKGGFLLGIVVGIVSVTAVGLLGTHYLDLHREAVAQLMPHVTAWWHGLSAGQRINLAPFFTIPFAVLRAPNQGIPQEGSGDTGPRTPGGAERPDLGSSSEEGQNQNPYSSGTRYPLLHEQIAKQIIDAVFSGSLEPGAALRELKLAKEFHVSQAPVRDALIRLHYLGLLERFADEGTFVRNLKQADLTNRVQVRIIEEKLAFTDALKSISNDHIRTLQVFAAGLRDPLNVYAEVRFHHFVWQLANNKTLIKTLDETDAPLFAFEAIQRRISQSYRERRYASAQALIAALETKNPAAVRNQLSGYIVDAYREFCDSPSPDVRTYLQQLNRQENVDKKSSDASAAKGKDDIVALSQQDAQEYLNYEPISLTGAHPGKHERLNPKVVVFDLIGTLYYHPGRMDSGKTHLDYMYPGVRNLLEQLKQKSVKLYMISSGSGEAGAQIAKHFGFDGVIDKDASGDALRYIMRQTGSAPENVIMVGDDPKLDIAIANKLRIFSVGHSYEGNKDYAFEKADMIIRDYRALPAILEAWHLIRPVEAGPAGQNNLTDTSSRAIEQQKYLADLPDGVIAIVQQTGTLEELNTWVKQILNAVTVGEKASAALLEAIEMLAYLFGLESKPEKGIEESVASIIKNYQLTEEERIHIHDLFYAADRYEGGKNWEDITARISDLLHQVRPSLASFTIFDRIKQYKSILLKLRDLKDPRETFVSADVSFNADQIIEDASAHREGIARDPISRFDDILGFNFVIDDTNLDEAQRSSVLTDYVGQVEALLRKEPDLKITTIRKNARVPRYEAVNIFIQGLRRHHEFGDLPIKIQFRFKTVLIGESIRYYTYKRYGIWEAPPWAQAIQLSPMLAFQQVQEALFGGFKRFIESVPVKTFEVQDHLTPRPGWPYSIGPRPAATDKHLHSPIETAA